MYNVVWELSNAGDHDPVIPLFEVVGNGDKAPPAQIGGTCVKVGVTEEFTLKLTELEQFPTVALITTGPVPDGVNVVPEIVPNPETTDQTTVGLLCPPPNVAVKDFEPERQIFADEVVFVTVVFWR